MDLSFTPKADEQDQTGGQDGCADAWRAKMEKSTLGSTAISAVIMDIRQNTAAKQMERTERPFALNPPSAPRAVDGELRHAHFRLDRIKQLKPALIPDGSFSLCPNRWELLRFVTRFANSARRNLDEGGPDFPAAGCRVSNQI